MDLGSTIRERRQALRLTLDEFATRCGVSRAMLSDIERSGKNPSIRVVCQIAEGLGTTVSDLLGEEGMSRMEPVHIVRKDAQQIFRDPRSGVERRMSAPAFVQRGLEIVTYVIPPQQSTGPLPPHQAGVAEYITIIQGQLHCHIAGQSVLLETGDALSFRADRPHEFVNRGSAPCIYFLVIDSRH